MRHLATALTRSRRPLPRTTRLPLQGATAAVELQARATWQPLGPQQPLLLDRPLCHRLVLLDVFDLPLLCCQCGYEQQSACGRVDKGSPVRLKATQKRQEKHCIYARCTGANLHQIQR